MWAIDRFGPGEIPPVTTIPMPLAEPKLELETSELAIDEDPDDNIHPNYLTESTQFWRYLCLNSN